MPQIPMECPKCGRYGSLPSNKLNTTLHCKKCGATFYVNSAGLAILGESPADRARIEEAAKKKPKREFNINLDFLRDLSTSGVIELPRLLAITGVLAVIGLIGYFVMNWKPTDPLIREATQVAKLIIDRDVERLRTLCSAESADQVEALVNRIHDDNEFKGKSNDYHIGAGIFSGGAAEKQATVAATIIPPEGAGGPAPSPGDASPATPGSAPPGPSKVVNLLMNFVMDNSGNWKLDANETLQKAMALRKKSRR
jgi:ribosomal protein S27AE